MPACDTSPRFISGYALETVPRYTSYPPATRFDNHTGQTDWTGWMQALPDGSSLSLYVHIPFCRSMCWYCACNTTIPNRAERVTRYLDALKSEIRRKAAEAPATARVRHLHFGGGSPDMLTPDQLGALMAELRGNFIFDGAAEIAIELDPRGLTAAFCERLAVLGFNRASLGVQDLSEEVQTLIHRVQPEARLREAVADLRAAGIARLNMDIMYGLPGQTVERVAYTAARVADLEPDRLAVFGYAHVPWFKKHQKAIPEDRLPGARARFDQMIEAGQVLSQAGYQAIGFDHYARPGDGLARAAREGRLRRNFQGYTDDAATAMIGLGASSIGETPLGIAQNITQPAAYCDAIEAGQSAIARGVHRSPQARATGAAIEALLCHLALPLDTVRRHVADPELALGDLLADGLVTMDQQALTVTEAGRPYLRNIAARLDPLYEAAPGRHSQAV